MDKYKKLKLTRTEIEQWLRKFTQEAKGTCTFNEKPALLQVLIEIPGQEIAMLNVYTTDKGLTISPHFGKNQDLSTKIAEGLSSITQKVEPSARSFKGINEQLFEDFKNSLDELTVIEQKHDEKQIRLNIKAPDGLEVTLTWYTTTHRLLIQGYNTKLFDDLSLWFLDKTNANPKEIIEMFFSSFEDLKASKIIFPYDLIDRQLSKKLGNIFNNQNVISKDAKKWLQASLYLTILDIELPDYYPTIACSFKVIEGILKNICNIKFGHDSFNSINKGFAQFNKNGHLKDKYKSSVANNAVKCIETMYEFYQKTRNPYQHATGTFESLIQRKEDAEDILNNVIILLKDIEPCEKDLFR